MAYVGSGLVASVTGTAKPKKKKTVKKSNVTYGSGGDVAVQTSTISKPGGGYTSKNMTGNSRSGQNFRSRVTSKGVVHEYEDGTRVLVKKKKTSNPSRKLY